MQHHTPCCHSLPLVPSPSLVRQQPAMKAAATIIDHCWIKAMDFRNGAALYNKPKPPPLPGILFCRIAIADSSPYGYGDKFTTSTTYNKFRDRTRHCTARSTPQVRSRSPGGFGGRIPPRALRPKGPCSGGTVFLDKHACGSRVMFRD